MAACQAVLSSACVCRLPALLPVCSKSRKSSKRFCLRAACSTQLGPRSFRETFRTNSTPLCRKVVRRWETCAWLGGDGDLNLNEDAIAEDFYSVLGLVSLGRYMCP